MTEKSVAERKNFDKKNKERKSAEEQGQKLERTI